MSFLRRHIRDLPISNKIILPLYLVLLVAVLVIAPVASRWIGRHYEVMAQEELTSNQRAVEMLLESWAHDIDSTVSHVADEAEAMASDSPEHLRFAVRSELDRSRLDYASVTLPNGEAISEGVGSNSSPGPAVPIRFVRTPEGWALEATTRTDGGTGPALSVFGGKLLSDDYLGRLCETAGEGMIVAVSLGNEIIGTSKGSGGAQCNECHAARGVNPSGIVLAKPSMIRAEMKGEPYMLLHAPFVLEGEAFGTYTVLLSLAMMEAQQRTATYYIYGAGLLLFILITGVETLVSRSITRPIGRLAGVSKEIASGNLSRKIDVTSNDEVGQLASSMATMTQHLSGQLRELGLLHQVSLAANSSLDLDHVLETLLENALKVLNADGGSIMLLDTSRRHLEVRVARGRTALAILNERVELDTGPAGWVVRHGRPLLLPDDLDEQVEAGLMVHPEIASSVSVPIETREGVLGVLNLNILAHGRPFDRRTVTFAHTLANNTAMAIDNSRHHEEINLLYAGLIRALAGTIDAKDRYTYGHSEMVARYAGLIGAHMGFEGPALLALETSAYLHDIGKIGVRDAVLTKPGQLTWTERRLIETHPVVGAQILEKIVFPWPVLEAVRHHHERWDGRGYPDGIAGDDIPLNARILSVADSFDAMTSNRPYRLGRTLDDAIEELTSCSGSQFDPHIVALFLGITDKAGAMLASAWGEFPVSHGQPCSAN
jgi:putative nucleotidyltransferase with HDIG domain